MRSLVKTITIGAAIALGVTAASAAWHPALAWPFYLDDPGSSDNIVGMYPGWPHDSQSKNGCVTCHTTNNPVYKNGPRSHSWIASREGGPGANRTLDAGGHLKGVPEKHRGVFDGRIRTSRVTIRVG